jgi:hypothetical protein
VRLGAIPITVDLGIPLGDTPLLNAEQIVDRSEEAL